MGMGISSSRSSARRSRRAPMAEINVTPFVDVMLVLLIIFMVTAPLISQGVEVDLPKTNAQPMEGTENKLVLTLRKDKTIYIGTDEETPIPYAQLEVKLKNNARLQQEKELYLHADRSLEYGFVVDVMATIRRCGVEKLGKVTAPVDGAPAK